MTESSGSPQTVPGAEPFVHHGSRTGVLLCHGFTGSPASMIPWARYLADHEGFSVRVPQLPGHGTTWQHMNTTDWTQWYGEVDAALSELAESCDHVVVAGLSMGGALALRLAEQRPELVAGLVLVNPAIALKRFDVKFVPLLSKLVASMPGIGNDVAKEGADELGYDRMPLRAMSSQLKLWKDVRAHLANVQCPVLLFRSANDHVVDDLSQRLIREGVHTDVTYVELHKSFHVATIDHDAEHIWERSAQFIDQVTSA